MPRGPVVGDLALHPSEIESRLRDITVYTLVDSNASFILITGDDSKSLCPFFMNRENAEAYQRKLAAEAPEMASKTRIIGIGLDRYYKYVTSEASKGEEMSGVSFRLIPDPKEVAGALEILRQDRAAGDERATTMEGVPIFQAESLEVKPMSGAVK